MTSPPTEAALAEMHPLEAQFAIFAYADGKLYEDCTREEQAARRALYEFRATMAATPEEVAALTVRGWGRWGSDTWCRTENGVHCRATTAQALAFAKP